MSRLRSFTTLLSLLACARAVPVADDDSDDDNDDDGCASDMPPPVQHLIASSTIHIPDSPPASILAPYQRPPVPHPSPSQRPHATLPVPHRSHSPAILGASITIVIALVAFALAARYIARRRRIAQDPFKDPPKSRFAAFLLRKSVSKKRLSDESWISPPLPSFGSPGSPLFQDLDLRRYGFPQRKLVPVTTPVCTPTDAEFGSRLELSSRDAGSAIPVPPVRIPSPVYISPFSPSPSPSPSSSSSLSPAPSTEPPGSPSPNPVRLSRLLSSTFGDSRVVTSPTRPTTAHLIQTARSYAHAYRPSSAITTSLYTPPTPSTRLAGTRSRTGFYPGPTDDACAAWERVRDTCSTVTTADTDMICAVPHLPRTVSDVQPSTSPFADPRPGPENRTGQPANAERQTQVGTSLGLKVRLSDASEHARYRLRERERERERQQKRVRGCAEQRLSTVSQTSEVTMTSVENLHAAVHRRSRSLEMEQVRREFKLRDSESVLREIGW